MPAAYFDKLRDEGYEISIQGSKQGSLVIHNNSIKLFSDISLPDSIVEAAKAAGAKDYRVSIAHIAEDMQHTNGTVAKQLNLIRAQIDDAVDTQSSAPKLS